MRFSYDFIRFYWNFFSDVHQNLISSKLHIGATEYFHPLVLEIQCPQNSTDRQEFSKNGQIVLWTSQNMLIHRKPEVENVFLGTHLAINECFLYHSNPSF